MGRDDVIDAEYVRIDEEEARDNFARNRAKVRAEFWPKLRRFARRIPFVEDVVAGYYCVMDSRTPFHVRATLMAALAYFVLPTDVIPDVLLSVGMIDDVAVLGIVIRRLQSHFRPEHYEKARRALED